MGTPRTIAIVGASFGGLGVAQHLEPYAERADVEIVLIDQRPYLEFSPLLYEVATGAVEGRAEDCEQVLASGVCINWNAYDRLLRDRMIRFAADTVIGIDRQARQVRLRSGTEAHYDALVLAYGAQPAFYGIPGLAEHSIPLKSTVDALRIRRRVLDLQQRARERQGARFSVVIGGGGATGIELACELANMLRRAVTAGDLRAELYDVILVEAASRLLSAFPERLSRIAIQRLHNLGVRVHLDSTVAAAEIGRLTIASRPLRANEARSDLLCGFDGDMCAIPADLIVWTAGIAPIPLGRDAGFACDADGRIRVGVDCAVEGESGVFALGDCALFPNPRTGRPLPALASVAVRQAPVVAANILAYFDGMPLRRFWPRTLPAIIPIGGKRAAFVYRRIVLVGWWAWAFHSVIALQYFVATVGIQRGVRLWWRGARVYTNND